MKSLGVQISQMLSHAILVLAGISFWIFIVLITVLSTPTYIYRWLITKLVAPLFRYNIGKAVSVNGQLHASEFTKLRKGSNAPSRLAIVVNCVIEGILPLDKTTKLIESRWIQASFKNGKLKYPEFQQYIDSWMGFMYFKKMNNFRLEEHVYLHKLDENGTEEEAESRLRSLIEDLVNKPFPLKKSPWEVHLVQNYKNSQLDYKPGKLSTVFILRIHHGMGDGFAVMHILVEALLGSSLNKVGIAATKPPASKSHQRYPFQQFLKIITFPINVLHESGFAMILSLRKKTPWHIPDSKKTWKQIYGRSRLIPIEKLKFIKNRLDVTFSSVLITCLTGASAEMISRSMVNPPLKMTSCFPVAIDRNRKKWRNQSVGVVLDVPCNPNMDIVSRLKECEYEVQKAKKSVMPFLVKMGLKLFSSQYAVVTRYISRNRYICTGMSNFPGPGVQIDLDGMKLLAVDFTAGALEGQAGVGFTILSYNDSIRICALAENAVLTRDQMNELIENICNLIDKLYVIAKNSNEDVKIDMLTEYGMI